MFVSLFVTKTNILSIEMLRCLNCFIKSIINCIKSFVRPAPAVKVIEFYILEYFEVANLVRQEMFFQ